MTDELGEAERLALSYAPAPLKSRYRALLAFDALLGRIALHAREPLPAQVKLAWWRDACESLPQTLGNPVLSALAASWTDPEPLVALVDAWEQVVLAEPDFEGAAESVARGRGAALASCAGTSPEKAHGSARAWTLVALCDWAPDAAMRERMLASASHIPHEPLPRTLRPLAVLAGLARRTLPSGGPLLGDRLSPLAAIRLGIFGR